MLKHEIKVIALKHKNQLIKIPQLLCNSCLFYYVSKIFRSDDSESIFLLDSILLRRYAALEVLEGRNYILTPHNAE